MWESAKSQGSTKGYQIVGCNEYLTGKLFLLRLYFIVIRSPVCISTEWISTMEKAWSRISCIFFVYCLYHKCSVSNCLSCTCNFIRHLIRTVTLGSAYVQHQIDTRSTASNPRQIEITTTKVGRLHTAEWNALSLIGRNTLRVAAWHSSIPDVLSMNNFLEDSRPLRTCSNIIWPKLGLLSLLLSTPKRLPLPC